MPQVLKDEIRDRIRTAALEVFASDGYAGATMAAIAARADLGTATIYRYYPGKDELFAAVITPDIAATFESLLDRRVRALAHVALARSPKRPDDLGEDILGFWFEHRLAIVVLLDRAEGTGYAHYGKRFVELLVTTTLAQLRAEKPGLRVTAVARFVLEQIFENTRRTLAAILAQHTREDAMREAIQTFWSYQIPGLRGFARHVLDA